MQAKFTYDTSNKGLSELFEQLFPNRKLVAEGMDNSGVPTPLEVADLSIEQVKMDIAFSTRAAI